MVGLDAGAALLPNPHLHFDDMLDIQRRFTIDAIQSAPPRDRENFATTGGGVVCACAVGEKCQN
jgi:hypothetical protein